MHDNLQKVIERYNLSAGSPSPILVPSSDRLELARLFCDLGYRVGAEIGVERGCYSEALCKAIPGLKLYCVDPWERYPEYGDWQGDFYQEAVDRLSPYHVRIVRKMSMEAAKSFRNGSLDFVYIDANHYPPYIGDDLREWSKKVRRGGIVSGHDYINLHSCVMEAVIEYTQARGINPWFIVGKPDLTDTNDANAVPSFFWVKP